MEHPLLFLFISVISHDVSDYPSRLKPQKRLDVPVRKPLASRTLPKAHELSGHFNAIVGHLLRGLEASINRALHQSTNRRGESFDALNHFIDVLFRKSSRPTGFIFSSTLISLSIQKCDTTTLLCITFCITQAFCTTYLNLYHKVISSKNVINYRYITSQNIVKMEHNTDKALILYHN